MGSAVPLATLRRQLIGLLRAEAPCGRFAASAATSDPTQTHAGGATQTERGRQPLGFRIVVIDSLLSGAGRGLALAWDSSGGATVGDALSIYPQE